ncbi:MAG: hypothetical protein IT452_03115 [Planctomycetia bacterium]|nr:hypothetical protein [Planctomycetia bacterium]
MRTPAAAPASTVHPRVVAWLYFFAFLASVSVTFIPHLCGHLHAEFLALSAPAAAVAWALRATFRPRSLGDRITGSLVVVVTTVILVLNVASAVVFRH